MAGKHQFVLSGGAWFLKDVRLAPSSIPNVFVVVEEWEQVAVPPNRKDGADKFNYSGLVPLKGEVHLSLAPREPRDNPKLPKDSPR